MSIRTQTCNRVLGKILFGSTALLAACDFATAARAQADTGSQVETVFVTAEKRTTPLQTTPVAITAFSADMLEKNRIVSFSDLAINVPNLTYTQFSTQESYFSIRGTLINNNGAGWDDAVTTFIDGVPTTGLGDQDPDLFDLSSIEVLRGPQGTLFGRNVTGGAIVIHTLPPSFDPNARLEATYGIDNMVQLRGLVTGPVIGDKVAAKLSVDYNRRDDYIDNVAIGGKTAGVDQVNMRGQLLWQASQDLEVLIGADYLRDRSGGYATKLFGNFTPALYPTLSYDPNVTNQAFNGDNERDIYGSMARVTWTNPFGVLTSITGYRNINDHFPNSLLGDPDNQILALGIVKDKQVTEEVDFASPTGGPVDWVAGLFYLHSDKREANPLVFNFNPLTVAGLFSAVTSYTQYTDQRIATDSYAIFGQADYAFAEGFKLTLGARETWERKAGTSFVAYNVVDPTLPPGSATYSHMWNAFTPKLTLTYQPTDDVLVYASAVRGFKSGGYDLSGASGTTPSDVSALLATPFAPETEWSYELGEKVTGFDKRLIVDGDLFLAHYRNLQTSQLVLSPSNIPTMITSNAPGTTTVEGLELESTAVPTDWLNLGLTYAYMYSHFA
ncbi:MAG TPA: TonB-dependent receptor, partial [Rhizomicrobium sp.]|nr:TonB-dependent receptor [Rhizomicrobium sp.]